MSNCSEDPPTATDENGNEWPQYVHLRVKVEGRAAVAKRTGTETVTIQFGASLFELYRRFVLISHPLVHTDDDPIEQQKQQQRDKETWREVHDRVTNARDIDTHGPDYRSIAPKWWADLRDLYPDPLPPPPRVPARSADSTTALHHATGRTERMPLQDFLQKAVDEEIVWFMHDEMIDHADSEEASDSKGQSLQAS